MLAIWGGEDTPPTEAEYEKLGLRVILYPVFCATAGLQAAWVAQRCGGRRRFARVEWPPAL